MCRLWLCGRVCVQLHMLMVQGQSLIPSLIMSSYASFDDVAAKPVLLLGPKIPRVVEVHTDCCDLILFLGGSAGNVLRISCIAPCCKAAAVLASAACFGLH